MKIAAIILAVLFAITGAFAHGVLVLIEDNGDGTIYIEAGLSTGGPAVGADVILRERSSGRPIYTSTIPANGRLPNVEQPTVAYTVTVSLGAGHTVTRNGPLAAAKPAAPKPTAPLEPKPHYHDGVRCTGH